MRGKTETTQDIPPTVDVSNMFSGFFPDDEDSTDENNRTKRQGSIKVEDPNFLLEVTSVQLTLQPF